MGKSMDAIVVDTEKTARECIKFMKEQHLQSETFYPLDYIDAAPIDERLRDIREPRNTKMLVDVIKSHPPQIKKVKARSPNKRNKRLCFWFLYFLLG
jgi:structural maintenance of chromosome 1